MEDKIGWTVLDHKAADLKIELKKSSSGFNMCRSIGTIDAPPKDIFRLMNCFSMTNMWNLNNDLNEQVAKTESLLSRVYGRHPTGSRESQSACGYSYNQPSILDRKHETQMVNTQMKKGPIEELPIRETISIDK